MQRFKWGNTNDAITIKWFFTTLMVDCLKQEKQKIKKQEKYKNSLESN